MAAETENQARDAVRAIKVEYEVLPHVATEALSMAEGAPKVFDRGNVNQGRTQTRGKPDEKMATAEVIIEGTYSVPMITHVCLETHGLTVRFDGRRQDRVLGEHSECHGCGRRACESDEGPACKCDGLHGLHGGRLWFQVRRRHLGANGGPALETSRRPAGEDVSGPGAGAPSGGKSAERIWRTSSSVQTETARSCR